MESILEEIILFLAQKYLWIIGITILIVFALIGYIVDEHDRKNGISQIDKPQDDEKNIHELAMNVGNKTLNTAVNDAVKNPIPSNYQGNTNNIIEDANGNQIINNPL